MIKAVEIGEMMVKAKQHPLSKDESLSFLYLFTMKDDPVTDKLRNMFIFKVIEKRLDFHNIKATDALITFLCLLSKDNPGNAILWCAALKYIQETTERMRKAAGLPGAMTETPAMLNLNSWVHYFPMGTPSEEDMEAIWQKQKIHDGLAGDNALDRKEAWE